MGALMFMTDGSKSPYQIGLSLSWVESNETENSLILIITLM